MVTRGLHLSGMKPSYHTGKTDVLAKDKGNLEFVVKEGSNELSVIDLGLIVVDSAAYLTNDSFLSTFLLETGNRHHLEESVIGGVNLIWGRSVYEWFKG